MTLVDGPDTVPSESTESPTEDRGDNGSPANTEVPSEGNPDPLGQVPVDQDQSGQQEGHISTADEDLGGLGFEGQEDIAFTGDDLP